MAKLFTFKEFYVKPNGVKVTKFTPNFPIYIMSIDLNTGKFSKERILELSKHENIKMYKLESIDDQFETFWASEDHSLIIYDIKKDEFRKCRPIDVKPQHYLVQYNRGNHRLISCERVKITYDPDITYGWDFTVENTFTFCTKDGIMVQDTMWIARTISKDADLAHVKNNLRYDHQDSLLYQFRHEMTVAAYLLSTSHPTSDDTLQISTLDTLPVKFTNIAEQGWVEIDQLRVPYGIALLNKFAGFKTIKWNKPLTKKQVSTFLELVAEECSTNTEYYERLYHLTQHLLWFITHNPITVDLSELLKAAEVSEKPLPHHPIGTYVTEKLIDDALERIVDTDLYSLFVSGARMNRQQLMKSCICGGYVADESNTIIPEPIQHAIVHGLTQDEALISARGTRKSILDKSDVTPKSGFTERTLVLSLSPAFIVEEDCGTREGILVTIPEHLVEYFCQHGKWRYWRFPEESEWRSTPIPADTSIILRSPLACNTKAPQLCRACCGDFPKEQVGVISAQCIAERFTQLVLRTFHVSGAASIERDPLILEFIKQHLLDYNETQIVVTRKPENAGYQRLLNLPHFAKVEHIDDKTVLHVEECRLKNNDIVTQLDKINSLFKANCCPDPPEIFLLDILDFYTSNAGNLYSLLFEVLLDNLYWWKIDSGEYKRYRQHPNNATLVTVDLIKIPKLHSTCLGMLFSPNTYTILDFIEHPTVTNSMHERIFKPEHILQILKGKEE